MNSELDKIIRNSTFKIEDSRFVYAKVKTAPQPSQKHQMVFQDDDEITVVTKEENVDELDLIEKNKEFYKLFALNVSVPFYSVGFLAAISNAISKENINVLMISTYSKDYVIIQEEFTERVKDILVGLGLGWERRG